MNGGLDGKEVVDFSDRKEWEITAWDGWQRITKPLHCHCANPACPALLQRSPANAHFRTATVFTASSNVLSSRPKTPCLRPLAEISAFGRPAERRQGFQ
jgi:hypothetical protein